MSIGTSNSYLECQICSLHVVRLYDVGKRKVCRFCKKDHKTNNKYTRPKVVHDYESARILIKRWHDEQYPVNKREEKREVHNQAQEWTK